MTFISIIKSQSVPPQFNLNHLMVDSVIDKEINRKESASQQACELKTKQHHQQTMEDLCDFFFIIHL